MRYRVSLEIEDESVRDVYDVAQIAAVVGMVLNPREGEWPESLAVASLEVAADD